MLLAARVRPTAGQDHPVEIQKCDIEGDARIGKVTRVPADRIPRLFAGRGSEGLGHPGSKDCSGAVSTGVARAREQRFHRPELRSHLV